MEKRNLRVSALAEGLAAIALILAIVTVISPYWGRFSNEGSPNSGDLVTGYFGLWTICKDLPQGRSFCGLNITAFNLSTWTFIAGVIAVVSVISLGLAALLGVCLLLMLKTQERVCLPYRPAVVARLVLSALAALMSTTAIALASIRTDERLPYGLSRGWTFYLQMLVIATEVLLTLASTYDLMLSRRLGGDPTFYSRDPSGSGALTYSNPSFKDDSGRPGGPIGGGRPGSGMSGGGGRPGSSNGSTTSNSSLNTIVSASSVRSAPNGKQVSTNGSRMHNSHNKTSSSGKSPSSGRASPKRPTTGRLANGAMIRAAAGRGSQRSRSSGHNSSRSKPTIALTASSAHPYSMGGADGRSPDSVDHGSTSSILNGSFGSIESSSYGTTSSIISSSSISSNPMALSPRKSSLKKPRPRNEVPASPVPEGSETGSILGFQNPGFGENRSGSIKRVRIASQSTDV
uniref:Transmembrane protein n=1 Tax=Daphnia galeata TaxID=27404 RepID=A0A8J2RCM9_9CRUS|nr:unnamed protein product [Daphnia galeata]